MKRWILAVAVAVAAGLGLVASAGESAAPCTASTRPKAPPKAAPTLSPEAQETLDRMDAAGKNIRTLRARFDYELNQTLYEDVQKRKGTLLFGAPNQLRFEFTDRPRETFVFDGRALYHKKDATKQLTIWEIRRPEEPPVDSFELGKTPFPMPFGQKKESVLKYFVVTRDKKEEAEDKKKRSVLMLKPKKGTELARTYVRIALWVDAKSHLPTRTRLWDTSENITTIDFRDIQINKKVDPKALKRPEVPEDWEIITHRKES